MIAFLRALLEYVAQWVDAGIAKEEAERELAGRERNGLKSRPATAAHVLCESKLVSQHLRD